MLIKFTIAETNIQGRERGIGVTAIRYGHKICLLNTRIGAERERERVGDRLDRDGHLHLIKNIIYVDSLFVADTKMALKVGQKRQGARGLLSRQLNLVNLPGHSYK